MRRFSFCCLSGVRRELLEILRPDTRDLGEVSTLFGSLPLSFLFEYYYYLALHGGPVTPPFRSLMQSCFFFLVLDDAVSSARGFVEVKH
jgi:hypothetical protein